MLFEQPDPKPPEDDDEPEGDDEPKPHRRHRA